AAAVQCSVFRHSGCAARGPLSAVGGTSSLHGRGGIPSGPPAKPLSCGFYVARRHVAVCDRPGGRHLLVPNPLSSHAMANGGDGSLARIPRRLPFPRHSRRRSQLLAGSVVLPRESQLRRVCAELIASLPAWRADDPIHTL